MTVRGRARVAHRAAAAGLVALALVACSPAPDARVAEWRANPYKTSSDCGPSTRAVTVSDDSELHDALADARPGDVIWLVPGTYEGTFTASRSGTAEHPITLCGPTEAVLDGGDRHHGYTLHLDGADYTDVRGLTVTGGLKGIMTDGWSHGTIDHVTVQHTGEEGIHLRRWSTDDTISNSRIRDTGSADPSVLPDAHRNGEGVYVGSSHHHWATYTNGQPDASDDVRIVHNTFTRTAAENVDIKEGTSGGLIAHNTFNGAGIDPDAADSWVDIKGNDYTVSHNRGAAAPIDGFQVHEELAGWGIGNVFTANVAHVDSDGYGFRIPEEDSHNTVRCDNEVTAAAQGTSNLACE